MTPDDQRRLAWKIYGSSPIYESKWIRLELVDVEPPHGQRFQHHVARLGRISIALVVDDMDRVLSLWRYRFATSDWGYELLGGLVEEGEQPEETARREVQEESGYQPVGEPTRLVSFQPLPGMVDAPIDVFLFRGAERIGEPTDAEEAGRIEWKPVDELLDLALRGELLGSGTLVPVLLYLAIRDRRK